MEHQILMAGFGGQGIMLMGQMLAYAGMKEGRYVSWMPSYGPEQRGGTANCSVVISDEPVGSPVVLEPTVCVVMNHPSLTRFRSVVQAGGHIFINSSLTDETAERDDIHVIRIAATEEAEALGTNRVANMIMLGALTSVEGLISLETLREVLPGVLPERRHSLIPLNIQALERGIELVSEENATGAE
ncbi:MAG: 2-oxoacid:acceptor oxidoreductase family protein [Bacillota bacterium]